MIAFFERQQQMQRQTRRMLLLFAAAVLGTVLAVDGLVWLVMRWLHGTQVREVGAMINSQTPVAVGVATVVVLAVILVSAINPLHVPLSIRRKPTQLLGNELALSQHHTRST